MVNTKCLNGLIEKTGLKKKNIAQNLKISDASFRNKLNNRTEFKVSEIEVLCKSLGISVEEIPHYFFIRKVESESTEVADGR